MTGFVREIYTSIQGEGIRVGQRQTFIRMLGCNLSCNYCDTPETQKKEGPFIYKKGLYKNPVEVEFLIPKITEPVVTITGGEPLLQIRFLEELLMRLYKMKKTTYLDTNATLPVELKKVIKYIDIVSLDFKIPTATGRPKLWKEHEACLKIASKKEVFVKMVINENLLPQELANACDIIAEIDKGIPLVIQPVFGQHIPAILDIQKKALERLTDVRIIPQVHKYLELD
jgi:7-carboxy-7-deazaguanine synthase